MRRIILATMLVALTVSVRADDTNNQRAGAAIGHHQAAKAAESKSK